MTPEQHDDVPYWQKTPEQHEAFNTPAYAKNKAKYDADATKAARDPAALPVDVQEKAKDVQSNVTNLDAVRAKNTKPAPIASDATEPYYIILAKLVLTSLQDHNGGDLMFIGKTAYRYLGGL